MKKIILTSLLILFSYTVFAQFSFGVKGGVNVATMTNIKKSEDEFDAKFKPSFYAGAFANFQLSELLSIQPEAIYSQQGFYSKITELSDMPVDKMKLWWRANFLNIPILLRVQPLKNFSIDIGPQIGFLLNSKVRVEQGGKKETWSLNEIEKELQESGASADLSTRKVDIAIAFGLTYNVTQRIDFSGRVTYGFIDYFKHNEGNKNSQLVLQFGLAYRIWGDEAFRRTCRAFRN